MTGGCGRRRVWQEEGVAGGGCDRRRVRHEESVAGGGCDRRVRQEEGVAGGGCGRRRVWQEEGAAGGGCGMRRVWQEEGVAGGGCDRRVRQEEGVAGGGVWQEEGVAGGGVWQEEGVAGGGCGRRRVWQEEGVLYNFFGFQFSNIVNLNPGSSKGKFKENAPTGAPPLEHTLKHNSCAPHSPYSAKKFITKNILMPASDSNKPEAYCCHSSCCM